MSSLDNKVAIVTGGARGIGSACARALCERGAAVVITDVLAEEGERTAKALRAEDYQVEFQYHDVTDEQGWQSVVAFTVERFGRVDCLVNNAGINIAVTVEEATEDQLRRILDVNFIGPFLGIKAVLPAMKDQGAGSIVNISSNSTRKLVAQTSLYGSAKSALAYLSKAAAVNFGEREYGIRVNSVHPGATRTDMTGGSEVSDEVAGILKKLVAGIPVKRMGEPEDIGAVVAFLASDDSRYVTAAELFVDGGASVV